MNTKNKLKDLYFERKLEPIHSIHAILAQIERHLYQGGILSGQNLALPDFLGIGATKAGTTWLYQNLFAHPDIFMPTTKELHYFDRRFDEILYVYTRKFKDVKGKIKGEITPAYSILNIERIKFIHLLMPDVRLIFIMRNPIERAWSEAIHNLLRKDKRRSFEDVPNEEIENILNSDAIVSRSQYTNP